MGFKLIMWSGLLLYFEFGRALRFERFTTTTSCTGDFDDDDDDDDGEILRFDVSIFEFAIFFFLFII